MINSLSIWLSSGGTDILGLRMDSKEWRLILNAFCTQECPQVGGRDLYDFLANGLKMKDPMEKNISVLSEENYY